VYSFLFFVFSVMVVMFIIAMLIVDHFLSGGCVVVVAVAFFVLLGTFDRLSGAAVAGAEKED
jgi:hypothetical protein